MRFRELMVRHDAFGEVPEGLDDDEDEEDRDDQ